MSDNTINVGLRRLGYSTDEMTAHGFRTFASTLLNESGSSRPQSVVRNSRTGDLLLPEAGQIEHPARRSSGLARIQRHQVPSREPTNSQTAISGLSRKQVRGPLAKRRQSQPPKLQR